MAQRALQDGLYILNQKIPSRNIEKEVFIKLKPCYNCFSYNHITKNCPEEKMILCLTVHHGHIDKVNVIMNHKNA